MDKRVPPAPKTELWSERDQVIRRTWEEPERDEHAQLEDPNDYSAIGGPETERSYGRTRSDAGSYPFGRYRGPADRDPYGHAQRGGYIKRAAPGERADV